MARILSFPQRGENKPEAAPSDASMTYEEFYSAYYQTILRYLRPKCAGYEDAEDLTAQCFVYCYEHWDSYRSDAASRKSWLFMVVQCRWKNYCRDHRQNTNLDDVVDFLPDEKDVIARTTELMSARAELAQALKQLPETQRNAVIMRYFGNMDSAQIARKLQTSEGNVRILIHRGVKKLGELMHDSEWGE